MRSTEVKSKSALGFLTVVEHPEQGLFGGYLVLNCRAPFGVPLYGTDQAQPVRNRYSMVLRSNPICLASRSARRWSVDRRPSRWWFVPTASRYSRSESSSKFPWRWYSSRKNLLPGQGW